MGTYPNAAWPNKLGLGTAGTAAAVAPVPFQVKLGEDLGVLEIPWISHTIHV